MKINRLKDAQSRVDFLRTQLAHQEKCWLDYVRRGDNKSANRVNTAMRRTRNYLHGAEIKLAREERKAYEKVRFAK